MVAETPVVPGDADERGDQPVVFCAPVVHDRKLTSHVTTTTIRRLGSDKLDSRHTKGNSRIGPGLRDHAHGGYDPTRSPVLDDQHRTHRGCGVTATHQVPC